MDATDMGLDGVGIAVEPSVPALGLITIAVASKAEAAACPCCGQPSGRLHGRYTRVIADLPRTAGLSP